MNWLQSSRFERRVCFKEIERRLVLLLFKSELLRETLGCLPGYQAGLSRLCCGDWSLPGRREFYKSSFVSAEPRRSGVAERRLSGVI